MYEDPEEQKQVIQEAKQNMLEKTKEMMDERIVTIMEGANSATGWFTLPGGHQDRWVQHAHPSNDSATIERNRDTGRESEVLETNVAMDMEMRGVDQNEHGRVQPNSKIVPSAERRTDSGRAVREMFFNGKKITEPVGVGKVVPTLGTTIEQAQALG